MLRRVIAAGLGLLCLWLELNLRRDLRLRLCLRELRLGLLRLLRRLRRLLLLLVRHLWLGLLTMLMLRCRLLLLMVV